MSYARTKVWVWFKDFVVPTWRISDKEPTDLKKGPAIPADAKWKFSGIKKPPPKQGPCTLEGWKSVAVAVVAVAACVSI